VGGSEVGVEGPIVGAGADGDDAGDASSGGAVEHGGEVAAAGEFGEVAMGVDEHGIYLFSPQRREGRKGEV
jgi:hypothetical protein